MPLVHHNTIILRELLIGPPLCQKTLVSRTAGVIFFKSRSSLVNAGNVRIAGNLGGAIKISFAFDLHNHLCF